MKYGYEEVYELLTKEEQQALDVVPQGDSWGTKHENPEDWLEEAFLWRGTKNGHDFWKLVYDRLANYTMERDIVAVDKPVEKKHILPTDAKERKAIPVYSGFVAYFPRAIAEVAKVSRIGNEQHNPGTPLHWDRSKSGDEKDALMRHILEGEWAQVAWRAMANLEKELEKQAK